ncbi:MAG: co-chaperone GroES [Fusobacteria bacterium]|nr:co-chaperone GroES [Fusobacteriota bacterium]
MTIKPIGKRVLIQSIKAETTTKSGILLPETATKEDPIIGEVLAVGTAELEKIIPVGSKIIYTRYSGTEIKDGETKFVLLNEEDVLAIVELL